MRKHEKAFCFNIIFRPLLFVLLSLISHQYLKLYEYALMYAFIISFFLVAIISDFLIFKNTSVGGFEKKNNNKVLLIWFSPDGIVYF